LIIWGYGIGPYGHIAIFVNGDVNSFTSFDQNYPIGSPCKLVNHNYNNVIGWLRAKQGGSSMTNKQIQELVWADPSTLIFAGKHDPNNRFAFLLLTGRYDYPGEKVKVLDDMFLSDRTINPEYILPQALALKTANEKLITQVNTLTTQLNGLDAKYKTQIDDLTKENTDLNNKITELNTLVETLKENAMTEENKKLLAALKTLKDYIKN
jgi:hypothetical protein